MENALGSIAASTLGFITGNTKGAKLAYNAFQTYHNTNKKRKIMANGSRSRSRGRTGHPTPPATGRRGRSRSMSRSSSHSLVSSMRSNPFSVRNKVMNVRSGDAKQGGHTISGKRVTKLKKKDKHVRISRQFKKKVDAALIKSSPSGYYQERYYNKFKPADFQQVIADLGGGTFNGEFGRAGGTLFFFDPTRVLDAASVLFNNKTPVGTNKLNSDANNFDIENFNCDVVRQWVEINIKNNSARNIEVKLWTWELKSPQLGSIDFGVEWINSFVSEVGVPLQDGKINQLNITPSVLGSSPALSPAMRNRFNIEEKIILLEPGKYFKHTVQGPRKKYEYPKFAQTAAGFVNAQKGIKGVCMGISVDNTSTTLFGAGNAGRVTDITATDGFGILTETIYNYVIKVPDQAGFTYPAAFAGSTMQTLKQKRIGPYAIKIWNDPGAAAVGTVTEIPDENPQNQGTTGI